MKKKILFLFIILILTTIGILFINWNKEEKEKISENISIILSSNEGNTTTDKFPDKDSYSFEKIECDNSLGEVTPTFNEETWKLNVSITGEKIESNFKCQIYFKEKQKSAADTIIAKYSNDNTEGLIKVEQPATEQMKSTTEYRYSGKIVKNYVNFNNEIWRIIGVFEVDDGSGSYEQRIKIIREESIGNYSWCSSGSYINDGLGTNQWGESTESGGEFHGAHLKTLLNETYYNKTTSDTCFYGQYLLSTSCDFSTNGLSETSKNMIDDAKWYTAGLNYNITTSTAYIEERSNALPPTGEEYSNSSYNDRVVRTSNWIGKIALLYPSDYGYASSSCYNSTTTLGSYSNCIESNWLYTEMSYYTLSPIVSNPSYVFHVHSIGGVHECGDGAYSPSNARPVVYLKSSVKITGGTGADAENAYQLSL